MLRSVSEMKIAALLPHVEVYGGVRRYLEIGNALLRRGHRFTLFTAKGERPGWLEFEGIVCPFDAIGTEEFDVALCGEYSVLAQFDRLRARTKFFYFVLEGHKEEKEVTKRSFHFLGASEGICRRIERKYGVQCHRAPGGINPDIFYPIDRTPPDGKFRILCYGRIYKKRKGIHHVIRAAERLREEFPGLRLIFFDSLVGEDRRDPRPLIKTAVPYDFYLDLPQSRMAWLYSQADIFASAERRAGWANTAAEALACRLPVVCTKSGTRDFALHRKTALVVPWASSFFLRRQVRRLILDPGLRRRLAEAGYEKIKEFTWEALARRLEQVFQTVLSN